ncbi:protein of unknown function [Amycolatopsis marina]|uniref:DUF397 domain-containing protein n=1 Tax=Amycolatopsis marina TaxID=490629 RepID=A0A1I0VP77_9PSEU|nr:DUF397 domain-containing protein [Amycolatopsis marina]SFA77803.1 protein of unknown function [Amycolatopsis marina]
MLLSEAKWRKSSRSGNTGNGGSCVEVAFLAPQVAVRDSKLPTGGALVLSPAAWRHFSEKVRSEVE